MIKEVPVIKTSVDENGNKVVIFVLSLTGVIYLGALSIFVAVLATLGWMGVKVLSGLFL